VTCNTCLTIMLCSAKQFTHRTIWSQDMCKHKLTFDKVYLCNVWEGLMETFRLFSRKWIYRVWYGHWTKGFCTYCVICRFAGIFHLLWRIHALIVEKRIKSTGIIAHENTIDMKTTQSLCKMAWEHNHDPYLLLRQ